MRRVLFSGYYGQGNAGDDMFCSVAAMLRDKATVEYGPWFLAHDLPPLATNSVAVHRRLPSWVPARARIGLSALTCHNVVLFGGSTLQRLNPTRVLLMRLASSRMIRLSAVGVSVGPFADHADAAGVVRFLRSCGEVVVRDDRSLFEARDLGLPAILGFDPAVLLPTLLGSREARNQTTEPVLGVSISAAGIGEAPASLSPRFTRLASLVRDAHDRTGAQVRVINMQANPGDGDDRATAWLRDQFESSSRVVVHTHDGDVVQTLEAIRGCTAVVGVRLHSCVLAYAVGVPFVLVDYHPKCRDFLETIGAKHARADSMLDNLDEVRALLDRALAGQPLEPSLAPTEAVKRCLDALGSTRLWSGVERMGPDRD